MTIHFTELILDDLPLPKKKGKRKQKGTMSFWCSHMNVLDAPDIFVTDLILLPYRKYAQMFLSPGINAAKI